jgi:hypothetical protein
VSDQNLIDGFCEKKNLIATRIKLFDKDTLSKVHWFSANFGKVEDLLAMVC